MTNDSKLITLVGCGNMGRALLTGWLNAGNEFSCLVVDPHGLPEAFRNQTNITHAQAPIEKICTSSVIVLAVKPQVMNAVCEELKPFVAENTLILSIAAGRSIASFEKIFGSKPIVRSMPNLPAAIGKGMTVTVANKNTTKAQCEIAEGLLKAVGRVEWVKDENLMHAVTAVSGSGPAYLFLLIEMFAEAARKAGLNEELALTLARETVIGAAALVEADRKTPAATLRKNVTSPGGTTEAALQILMNGKMQTLFDAAIESAKKRSEDLSL